MVTENKIAMTIEAEVDGGSAKKNIEAASVRVAAEDKSSIQALAGAASAAVAISPKNNALALAIGVSAASNMIDNEITASLANLGSLKTTGDVVVTAFDNSDIDSSSVAIAVFCRRPVAKTVSLSVAVARVHLM